MRYKLIRQKPYCCVPACLSMILSRRRIKHGTQEEVGYELGLTVPKSEAKLFGQVRTGKKPTSGWGTQVRKKQFSINHYFSKHRVRLREQYYPTATIKNLRKFIAENLAKGNDIITCFNGRLYGKGNWGHTAVVKSVSAQKATLLDPARGIRKVEISKLGRAIRIHGKSRRGGLWVIGHR